MRTTVWVSLALFSLSMMANEESDGKKSTDEEEQEIETVTVVATRSEQKLSNVAAAVSVITNDDIERQGVRDIRDLVRYEPGVSVQGTGSQWGLAGFSIRGLGGNRVLTTIDGVRVPDEFSFGPFLGARRDFVDVDRLERVEIVRGPMSSLYGSDAMAGVVAFSTESARDYLTGSRKVRTKMKTGYASSNEQRLFSGRIAAGRDRAASLLNLTFRKSSDFANSGSIETFGPSRELPDPQISNVLSVSSRTNVLISDHHELEVKVETYKNKTETRVYSDYNTFVFGTLINSRDSTDDRSRQQYAVIYRGLPRLPLLDQIEMRAFLQDSETDQRTIEDRTSFQSGPQVRERVSNFRQRVTGLNMASQFLLEHGDFIHGFTYGFDYQSTSSESNRDGSTRRPDGTPVFNPFVILPTRDFPLTDVTQSAFFVQDEISMLDSRLLVTPGLRLDRFSAKAVADELYRHGNPGVSDPSDYGDSHLTTKLSAVYRWSDQFSVYGNRSGGFRAPPYDDVNIGFTNLAGGYKTISNADLQSETSTNTEFGIHLAISGVRARITRYQSKFENFIEPLALAREFLGTGGVDPSDGLRTFQSRNRGGAEVSGIEIAGSAFLTENLGARFSFASGEGKDKESNTPLSSIEPRTLVVGLRYIAPSKRWDTELVFSQIAEKKQKDIDPLDGRISTDSYQVIDALVSFRAFEKLLFHVGVFNLTDQTYIRWADTIGIGNDAPQRFTQPGRNFSLTAGLEW